jgi:hypothetical protein
MTVRGYDCSPDDDYHLPWHHHSGDSRLFAPVWPIITTQKSGSRLTAFVPSSPHLSEDNPDYHKIIGITTG